MDYFCAGLPTDLHQIIQVATNPQFTQTFLPYLPEDRLIFQVMDIGNCILAQMLCALTNYMGFHTKSLQLFNLVVHPSLSLREPNGATVNHFQCHVLFKLDNFSSLLPFEEQLQVLFHKFFPESKVKADIDHTSS